MEVYLLGGMILILLVFSIMGYIKGSLKILLSLGSLFASLILVFVVYPTAVSKFNDTVIHDVVEKKVSEYVDDNLKLDKQNGIEHTGIEGQQKIIENMPLPKTITKKIKENNTEEEYKELKVDNFEDYVKAYLVKEMMQIISFAIVFIVIHALMILFVGLTRVLSKLPAVESLDRTLGVIIGLFEGYILILIFCIVITALSGTGEMEPIFEAINNNKILSTIYENNFLMMLILYFL